MGTAIGVLLIFACWAAAAGSQPELVLPSPEETASAFAELLSEGAFFSELTLTLGRAAAGVAIAIAIGVTWGTLSGASRWLAAVSQPALSTLMAVPPVVLVVIGLTWYGPGANTTRLVIVLVAIPLIVIAAQEAVRNIDADLLEMSRAFGLSRWRTFLHVVMPAIASPVLAATSVTLGQAVRVAVMAELLSAADGVGADMARARTNLETADLFAWTITLIVVVMLIELAVIRPLTNRLLRWRAT